MLVSRWLEQDRSHRTLHFSNLLSFLRSQQLLAQSKPVEQEKNILKITHQNGLSSLNVVFHMPPMQHTHTFRSTPSLLCLLLWIIKKTENKKHSEKNGGSNLSLRFHPDSPRFCFFSSSVSRSSSADLANGLIELLFPCSSVLFFRQVVFYLFPPTVIPHLLRSSTFFYFV